MNNLKAAKFPTLQKFSLALSAAELHVQTECISSVLTNAASDIAKLSKTSRSLQNTLFRLQDAEGLAASLQAQAILPSLVHSDASVRAASNACKKQLKDVWDDLYNRKDLYNAIKSVATASPTPADPTVARLLNRSLRLFERNGVGLPDELRKKYQDLRRRIVELEYAFQRNINEDASIVWATPAELVGCSDSFLGGLTKKVGDDGVEVLGVALKAPQITTALQRCQNAQTRKRLATELQAKCRTANMPIMAELVNARHEAARIMQFDSHADFMVENNMAGSVDTVIKFLNRILDKMKPVLESDMKVLKELKQKELEISEISRTGDPKEDKVINLWDVSYYEDVLRMEKYAIDEEAVKEFFPIDTLTKNILETYQKLFHLTFQPIDDDHNEIKWSAEVKAFAVYDNRKDRPKDLLG
ncbi:hypothetical protein HK096_002438, partial [Nowakowskiella sp. JEL0078]